MGSDQPAEEVGAARKPALLTTGDMARLTGNTLRTVRFYEESGILTPDRRSAGGHRLFGHKQLERLQFVSDMRTSGLSLDSIRAMLALKENAPTGSAAAEQAARTLREHLGALDDKIALLKRVRDELRQVEEIVVRPCKQCTDERRFPEHCSKCDVIRAQPDLSQSMRVLWDVAPDDTRRG